MAPAKKGLVTENNECFNYVGQGPWFTTHADGVMPARCAEKGISSKEKCPPSTIMEVLTRGAEKKGQQPALLVERPVPPLTKEGKAPPALERKDWKTFSFNDYLNSAQNLAKGCISVGFQPYDTLNIWGFNAPEWMISCVAASFAGGKAGGLYPTDTDDIAAFKVVHSGGCVVCVDDDAKTKKLLQGLNARDKDQAKRLKAIVAWAFDPAEGSKLEVKGCGTIQYLSFAKMSTLGGDQTTEMQSRVGATTPGNCAALIYTSGTTGDPKAVMISHDNIIFESFSTMKMLETDISFGSQDEERVLSYLPLSHIAGMMVDIVAPIIVGAMFTARTTCFFARSYDLKANSIKDRLCAARPTMFLGVPLVWEKMADRIRAIGLQGSATQQKIGAWAKAKMLTFARNGQIGGSGDAECCHCFANTILKKVKSAVGFDALRFACTGAAPIRPDTLEYFGSLGIFINEAYGMSECTGGTTFSLNDRHQWSSCGFEIPGSQVRAYIVDPKDLNKKTECERAPTLESSEEKYQGELCFKGRHIMMGYLACSDFDLAHRAEIEKKTAETIDAEGWLHSGDKGLITKLGFVKITGRYKELIIGAGGENIAPVPIENSVKKNCDGINEVMMIGDQRKYNVCFITLKAVGANGEGPGTGDLDAPALKYDKAVTTIEAAMSNEGWIKRVGDAIENTNNDGSVCPNPTFKIQKYTILPTNFSEEGDELTPTKKLKRKKVETKYAKMIDVMYAQDGKYIKWVA